MAERSRADEGWEMAQSERAKAKADFLRRMAGTQAEEADFRAAARLKLTGAVWLSLLSLLASLATLAAVLLK